MATAITATGAAAAQGDWQNVELGWAGHASADETLRRLGSSTQGLSSAEASRRLEAIGPNAISGSGARWPTILRRQFNNPLLLLLGATAAAAYFFGDKSDALIIFIISSLSIGLGFFNEYRSERSVAAMHARIRHRSVVIRDGHAQSVDVTQLVPGDVVQLDVGDVVPADVRLLEVHQLECDEAVLTGESMTVAKTAQATAPSDAPLKLPSCAYMGTVVRAGTGTAVVVRTGARTAFGRIAQQLSVQPPVTAFQRGLQDFSLLLVRVTAVLCVTIFVLNAVLGRPLIESALFALSIAVGLTPQLLPAIVTISLSYGADRLAKQQVLVKRLISIEDLGNVEVLFSDKTGTLTEGTLTFRAALDAGGQSSDRVLTLGLLCNAAAVDSGKPVGGNPLDQAIWQGCADGAQRVAGYKRVSEAPFDYDRKVMSVLIDDSQGKRTLITKGAPELVMARCQVIPQGAKAVLDAEFAAGRRTVAVASRDAQGLSQISAADEQQLTLEGFLSFTDPLKAGVGDALNKLAQLNVQLKIVTGDNERVARKVCSDLGMAVEGTLVGSDMETMTDDALRDAIAHTTIFARVTPDQKSRIIRLQRSLGVDVGFMGDGVNDAVALHEADVGISVDSATDVAKDAADIVLLQKDLGILAQGVVEGRRIFSNTIKYVLMGTSSNFGNMFSAAGASLILPFLPMTPTQILLNNLLYDVSEMTIPTDNVDEELLRRPAHWDMGFIKAFMIFFGPISSIFDFATFAVMIFVFNATHSLFQTGWFVESISTQTLVIFVIRTRRVPFFRSQPSWPLLVTSLACVMVAILITVSPFRGLFGFSILPPAFFGVLGVMVVIYLTLVEVGKVLFFRFHKPSGEPVARAIDHKLRRVVRRASWLRVPS